MGDLIVVVVLVDLFCNLEFSGGEVVIFFQEGEGVGEVRGFWLRVGDLVEDCIQVHADGLEVEHVFIGEWAVFFCAEKGEDA